MIVELAILVTWIIIAFSQPLPSALIPVPVLGLEKAAVLNPGNRVLADGECLALVIVSTKSCQKRLRAGNPISQNAMTKKTNGVKEPS